MSAIALTTKKAPTKAPTKVVVQPQVPLVSPANNEDKINAELTDTYREMTDKEHVLEAPDTYIGTVSVVEESHWVLTDNTFIQKSVKYVPGLLKLFDEAIINCRDQSVRMAGKIENADADAKASIKPVTYIKLDVDVATGTISLTNDGNGIDVAVHPVSQIWIPEMIFARMRTGTNYDKTVDKIVGGKNGFGAKLIFIWSTWGKIETVDHIRGLKYEQEFTGNLSIIGEPKITKVKATLKPYTTISFRPDYQRIGIPGLTADTVSLIQRRAYDIAGITDKKVAVWFNGNVIDIRTFSQYVEMYLQRTDDVDDVTPDDDVSELTNNTAGKKGKKTAPKTKQVVHEQFSDRWEYAVCLSPFSEFHSVSFVNGINTYQGGRHVDYVLNQIISKIIAIIEKKRKIVVNATSIKEQIMLFVRCDIVNPSFDSQSKKRLETPVAKFGSACVVSDKFVEKVAAMVMDAACRLTEAKDITKLKRKLDGSKTVNVRNIEQLTDAHDAGTVRSINTTLIITEGDSAASGVKSGLTPAMLRTIGIFSARGKLLNVRDQTINVRDSENKTFREVMGIIKSLGLEMGREYNTWEDVKKHARYGSVTLFADQDFDGSHIKGLFVNLLHTYWPSLFRLDGFIRYQVTPILIASKGDAYKPGAATNREFYDQGEYNAWQKTRPSSERWHAKYFKGLGTSGAVEFKQYMAIPKTVKFKYLGKSSDDKVDMWFRKKRANDRKNYLENEYDRTKFADMTKTEVSYDDFFDFEMSHFSNYDNERSLASMVDGLKPSLRKILFSAFKRNLVKEVKVAQFAGYVSENAGYHHGEASLLAAIVHMAQPFTGANNIPLLWPCGQFGTRILGGKDAASPRYIYTHLSEITRNLFRKEDDPILTYLADDSMPIEPEFYIPILPLVLINGTSGIGTGWSTDVPQYSPSDVCRAVRSRINTFGGGASAYPSLIPSYDGFRGTITPISADKFMVKGVYTMPDPSTVVITEVPVGTWLKPYVDKLNITPTEENKRFIRDVKEEILATSLTITIQLSQLVTADWLIGSTPTTCSPLEKLLELGTTLSTTNMVLHDANLRLHKYTTPEEIIDAFIPVRRDGYVRRKAHQLAEMRRRLPIIENKVRYIREIIAKKLVPFGLGRADTNKLLRTNNYFSNIQSNDVSDSSEEEGGYAYLLDMKMGSLISENIVKLETELKNIQSEIQTLESTTPEQLWTRDLDEFDAEYQRFLVMRDSLDGDDGATVVPKKVTKKPRVNAK
jgi:DNA topoisomerase-2